MTDIEKVELERLEQEIGGFKKEIAVREKRIAEIR